MFRYPDEFYTEDLTYSSGKRLKENREIAELMTDGGDKINHSTARNIFLRAMRKIAHHVTADYEECNSDEIAEDPRFQSAVQELAAEIYNN